VSRRAFFSLLSVRRFVVSCASADRAGTTTVAAAAEGEELDDLPFVQLSSDILQTELSLLKDDDVPASGSSLLAAVERKDGGCDRLLGETAAYPGAMAALYAACLAGNVTEQLWNFTWPAAIATLHPSLLPVAVLGFFTKVRRALFSFFSLTLQQNPHSLHMALILMTIRCAARGVRGRPAGRRSHELATSDPHLPIANRDPGDSP
jgi:hypothetical protein